MARPISDLFLSRIAASGAESPLIVDRITLTSPLDPTVPASGVGRTVYRFTTTVAGQRPDPATGATPRLRRVEGLQTDLGSGVGRILLALENDQSPARPGGLNGFIGYQAEYLRLALDPVDATAAEAGVVLLSGVVTASRQGSSLLELEVSTRAGQSPLLASRPITSRCSWSFRSPECGYTGPETTCNKTYDDPEGCAGRFNQPRFGGFPALAQLPAGLPFDGPERSSPYRILGSGSGQPVRRSALLFDETFEVTDSAGRDATVITSITPDWLNAQSVSYSAAGSGAVASGAIRAGSSSLTVDSPVGWRVGHGIRIEGAGAGGGPLTTTVSSIQGHKLILAAAAESDVGAATVGHDDSAAVQAVLNAGSSGDRTVFLPAGTYFVDGLELNSPNSIHIIGAGPGCTILRSRGDNPILEIDARTATAHSITIEGVSFIGSAGDGAAHPQNIGLALRDSGGHGIFNVTVRNCRFEDCGGSAIRTSSGTNAIFTVLLEGLDISQPPTAAGDAIDLFGSNDLTLIRCYVHRVASGRAAYRIRSGAPVFIGCNGIDSGELASWGVFGQNLAEDGVQTYVRATMIGCNIEDFTRYAIHCKAGSTASFFNTRIIAPASGEVTPIRFDYVGENQAGIFDGQSSIERKNSLQPFDDSGYAEGEAIHSDGLPFIQIGNRCRSTFYDLSGRTQATLPGMIGTRITGSAHYALTNQGYTRISGHLALDSEGSPVTPPAGSGFLYARLDDGSTGLFWQTSESGEQRIDQPVSLASGQIAFGSEEQKITGSNGLTFDGTGRKLTLSHAGGNPFLLVSDTSNSIDLRIGTLAGAPDRGIIGTMTDKQFVIYQNGEEAWGMNSTRHWTPFAGDNRLDLGTPNARVRDGHFARDLRLGGLIHSTGQPPAATPGKGAGTAPVVDITGSALAGRIVLRTGTNPAASAPVIDLTLPGNALTLPIVTITPANAVTARLTGPNQVFVDDGAATPGSWRLTSGQQELTESTEYCWYFTVIIV